MHGVDLRGNKATPMKNNPKQSGREKVNFMLDRTLFLDIKQYVPEGERSDFANEAFEQALIDFKRAKAYEEIKKLRKINKVHVSTEEILQTRDDGRK